MIDPDGLLLESARNTPEDVLRATAVAAAEGRDRLAKAGNEFGAGIMQELCLVCSDELRARRAMAVRMDAAVAEALGIRDLGPG